MSRLNYILSRHRTLSQTFAYGMPGCFWFGLGSKLFANIENRREREREREREPSACIRISCNLEKSRIGAEHDTWRCFSCASAFARQSRIFDSIDALHAFYRMHKYLNWRNILSWIFSSFFKGVRIQISLKADHHRPASETPLNGVSLACRWWPNVECWLGSFENFKGSGSVLLRNSIFLWFFRGGGGSGPPVPPLDPRMGPDNVYTFWDKTEHPFYRAHRHRLFYDTLYRMHKFLNWRNLS